MKLLPFIEIEQFATLSDQPYYLTQYAYIANGWTPQYRHTSSNPNHLEPHHYTQFFLKEYVFHKLQSFFSFFIIAVLQAQTTACPFVHVCSLNS